MAKIKDPRGGWSTRDLLAIAVVAAGIVGIIIVSAVAIGFAKNRAEMARLVFASILPLIGTWVGTVLAFYFARENLQAATESTIRLSGRLEPQTPVQQVMIPKAKIKAKELLAGDTADAVTLKELNDSMQSAGVHRIPIVDSSGAVKYVVHDSTIDKFAAVSGTSLTAETMADLLKKPELKEAVEAFATVGPNAVLADARAAMGAVKNCNDVFVTEAGQRTDPMIGWLTNTDMAGLQ